MENITLIGMPGVGKSTVGVILAKVLGKQFIDSDLVIQEQNNDLLCDIIEKNGIEEFLELESLAVRSIHVENTVIATGGSVVYKDNAMQHIKKLGRIVYLELPYEDLEKRLSNVKGRGVVLREGQSLYDLYKERIPLYEKYADIIINESGLDIEKTVAEICKYIS